ncbi:MAG: 23S rRNA pseudouridine1911/1915/1917 synthase [Sphingobacteriales bacterium]|jgi:23S rRNA pseudouridine1911/1915/1917 synthase
MEIIHENKAFIVVNKQAGLISEKSPFEEITVENQVLDHLQAAVRNPFIGVIHRLDRVTSGVILFAKKKSALVRFNGMFSERKVQKTYLAIVAKKPPKEEAVLTHFLIKNKKDKRADVAPGKSKEALESKLSYKLLGKNEFGYLLEVKPTTGRFHQIRAQLAHIGLPIIGDEKYGSDQKYEALSICLHAWKLSYPDLDSGEPKEYEGTMPDNEFWKFDLG